MIRKYLLFYLLLFCFSQVSAQQYGLFNSKTLFDGFENPAQKTFVLDSSRQFASSFFLPNFGFHVGMKGNENVLRTLAKEGIYSTADVALNTGQKNNLFLNSNIYILNFKLFKSYKYHQEIGLSWQVRADAQVNYTNETLAIVDNYLRFVNDVNPIFKDAFNGTGYAQSYHQFSFTYRENYDKKLAFGVKLSLLSGITYNEYNINKSYFALESPDGPLVASLRGTYRASFLNGKELGKKTAAPFFKNPGASISFGTTYTSKSGVFIMGNIKDLGFIKWSKNSYVNDFDNTNDPLVLDNLLDNRASAITSKVSDIISDNAGRAGFYSPTNAKADFLIAKTFGFYRPSFIVSKDLFHQGGDVALVNKFYNNGFSVSAIPTYNLHKFLMMGVQGMYQTPNFEVFIGSDNLFRTTSLLTANNDATNVSTKYNTASVYLGASIKFGYVVEHPLNSSYMPGVGDDQPGFFKRLFSIFKKGK
ncbi:MAG: DUF5723 family protein [Bacteroidota bacterium]